jgi:hypothetical protein
VSAIHHRFVRFALWGCVVHVLADLSVFWFYLFTYCYCFVFLYVFFISIFPNLVDLVVEIVSKHHLKIMSMQHIINNFGLPNLKMNFLTLTNLLSLAKLT